VSGPDEAHLARVAHDDLKQQLARVREEVARTRKETLQITAEIAVTERHLATTLRLLAGSARAEGRLQDAERLERHADEAQHFAAAEEQRVTNG
jgi:hypothetical protein